MINDDVCFATLEYEIIKKGIMFNISSYLQD
jgi:hypothetical protein